MESPRVKLTVKEAKEGLHDLEVLQKDLRKQLKQARDEGDEDKATTLIHDIVNNRHGPLGLKARNKALRYKGYSYSRPHNWSRYIW
jgi:hypothetical protein